MNFRYVAFDSNNRRIEGDIEVVNESAAEQALWDRGLTVVQLTPVQARPSLAQLLPTFFGVKRSDLIVFSRQLATLISSGIGILPALRLLSDQVPRQALRDVLHEVAGDLEQGQSFSSALMAHPLAVPDLYSRTITVGERSGNLEESLRQLADYYERQAAMTRKMRDALAYPVLVLGVAIFVVALMLTTALPPMVQLFESFEADLPLPTRILIGFSGIASQYGVYALPLGLVLAAFTAYWASQPSGQRLWDRLVLRIPLVGRLVIESQLSQFTRTTSVLISAGLPLSEVMELAIQTTGNSIVAEALERARVALLSGQGLSAPLSAEDIFPQLVSQMIRVGEETGTLEANLETLADFYEGEVDRSVRLLASLAEPVLTLLVGGVVGFIAVSLVAPMYSIMSSIK
jgi:type IV pilus assembly protein PilC